VVALIALNWRDANSESRRSALSSLDGHQRGPRHDHDDLYDSVA
jgi:hypothetical protein